MSEDVNWDVYNKLQAEKSVTLYGQTYELATMDEEEIRYYDRQFDALIGTTDSILRRILAERKDTIFQGVRAIKEKLDSRAFRGLNPNDAEIGFSLIRPGHVKGWKRGIRATYNILQDSTALGWRQYYGSAQVWYDWLAAAAATGFLLSEDFGLIITHLTSYNTPTPLTGGVRVQLGRTVPVPIDVNNVILGDNAWGVAHYPLPTIVALPESQLLVRTQGTFDVTAATPKWDRLQLGGITVGIGRFLSQENYSAVAYW